MGFCSTPIGPSNPKILHCVSRHLQLSREAHHAQNPHAPSANPGRKAANAAADAIGALVAFPEWPEGCPDDLTDYNDLAAWNTANARL